MKCLSILFIRAYQWCIRPFLGTVCRFTPSCSEYTLQAIQKHGFLYGIWLGGKRIIKCHPRHPGGMDNIP